MIRTFMLTLALAWGAATGAALGAEPQLERVAHGLANPWAVAFLPDGRYLVTERAGRLRIVEADGRVGAPVEGLLPVDAGGQCGLLDVVLENRGPASADEGFDADVAITTGELRGLLPDLIEALGGPLEKSATP